MNESASPRPSKDVLRRQHQCPAHRRRRRAARRRGRGRRRPALQLVDHTGVGRTGRGDHDGEIAAVPSTRRASPAGSLPVPAIGGGRHHDRSSPRTATSCRPRRGGVGDSRQPASAGHVAGDGERHRLPFEPPNVKQPPDPSGIPANCRMSRAPGSRQQPLRPPPTTTRRRSLTHRPGCSIQIAAVLGDIGMNARYLVSLITRVVVDGALEHLPRGDRHRALRGDRPVEQRRDPLGVRRASECRAAEALGDASCHLIGKVVDAGATMQRHGPGYACTPPGCGSARGGTAGVGAATGLAGGAAALPAPARSPHAGPGAGGRARRHD